MSFLEELEAEIARRESMGGGATQKVANPAGPVPAQRYENSQLMEALKLAEPSAPPEASLMEQLGRSRPTDVIRSGLEGLTVGASNPIGAGIATAMALPQALRQQAERQRSEGREPDLMEAIRMGVPETYRDIRGSLQLEEDQFREDNAGLADAAQLAGGVAGFAALAGPSLVHGGKGLVQAVRAAKARGAARVAGGTGQAAQGATQGARTGAAAKPRFKLNTDGTKTPLNKAAKKAMEKANRYTRKDAFSDGARAGGALDAVEFAASGDMKPDAAAMGALAGVVMPKAVRNLMVNSPLGRLIASRAMSKVIGNKYQPYIYTGMHPATRRAMKQFVTGGK